MAYVCSECGKELQAKNSLAMHRLKAHNIATMGESNANDKTFKADRMAKLEDSIKAKDVEIVSLKDSLKVKDALIVRRCQQPIFFT